MEFTPAFFDSSSRAWLANKKRTGAVYKYKCAVETCGRMCKNSLNCKEHVGDGIVIIHKGPMTRSMAKLYYPCMENK